MLSNHDDPYVPPETTVPAISERAGEFHPGLVGYLMAFVSFCFVMAGVGLLTMLILLYVFPPKSFAGLLPALIPVLLFGLITGYINAMHTLRIYSKKNARRKQ